MRFSASGETVRRLPKRVLKCGIVYTRFRVSAFQQAVSSRLRTSNMHSVQGGAKVETARGGKRRAVFVKMGKASEQGFSSGIGFSEDNLFPIEGQNGNSQARSCCRNAANPWSNGVCALGFARSIGKVFSLRLFP